jgi:glycosyltransferase involved in cell wall biosynthesis
MRIAVDARSLLNRQPRGEGRALRNLYAHIASLRPAWEIKLFGEVDCGRCIPASNVFQRTLAIPGFRFNLWENLAFPVAAKAGRCNLIHGAGSSLPRIPFAPAVMTVHDVIPLVFDEGQSKFSTERFRRQLEYGLRSARKIIAVSARTKHDLLSLFHVDAGRIEVIHWGVATSFSETGAKVRQSTGAELHDGQPYLIAFAGDARRKNTENILNAFAQLPQHGPKLVLVGLSSEATRQRFGTVAARLGCEQRVVMLDYVADCALDQLLKGALALLYVSLYEGFGLPLLEAMIRGVPVVAANASSIPEVVGDAALLVDPTRPEEIAAAAMELIESSDRRQELAARGIARASTFTWQATAQRTIDTFEAAAKSTN